MQRRRKHGFTLIEVLLVVVVMLLLAGFLFRIARMVADRANIARAKADLQMLANALEEFYSEYGNYPPVRWGDASWTNAPLESGGHGLRNKSMMYQFVPEQPHPEWPDLVHTRPMLAIYASGNIDGGEVGYHYGLLSYLLLRDRPGYAQPDVNYIRDSRRDENAKRRWAHYLEDINTGGGEHTMYHYASGQRIWQLHITAVDPWGRSYGYEAYPPFLSYRLWSAGPDGSDNSADDIEVSSP